MADAKIRGAGIREKFDEEDTSELAQVTLAGAETLTNKTLTTPVISTFYKDAGKTKLMTVPNVASDTLVAVAAAQTLTNKTLTAPVITGGTSTGSEIVTAYAADGAIAIANGTAKLTKGSAGAYTLAAPAAGDDGTVMHIVAGTDYAHVITIATTSLLDGTNTAKGKCTTAAYIGSGITIVAVNQKWLLRSSVAATLAAS